MARIWIPVLLIIAMSVPVLGADVPLLIDAEEKGYTISFFDEYYIVNLNGTLTLENPSEMDLFEIMMKLDLSTLQFELEGPEEGYEGVTYRQGKLYIPTLASNTSRTIRYHLFGITSDKALVDRTSILINAIRRGEPQINMQNIGSLRKAPLEDPDLGGSEHTRLVSAEFHNPTDFEYWIGEVRIIKTGDLNLNQELDSWSFQKQDERLDPHEQWSVDVLDENAYEGEIYWLSVDFAVRGIQYNESLNVTYYTQRDLYKVPQNDTNATENISDQLDLMIDRVYIRKQISKNLVVAGDEVEVVLLINNFAPTDFKNVSVRDIVPPGFEVVDSSDGRSDGENLSWDSVTLNSRETRRISYDLKYTDEESFGLDYFDPARLYYGDKMTMSESIPFVRKYMPETRLFVQKKIKFLDDTDNVKVTIQLQNVGESTVDNIVLNEYLSRDSEFKEVSKPFTNKGIWKIERINQSQVWETSYTTDIVSVLNTFPVVYGVESKSVMRTIILSNVIETEYSENDIHLIEIGGIVAILIIAIIFFLPKDFFNFKRRGDLRRLKSLKGNISDLKGQTAKRQQEEVARPQATTGSVPPKQGPVKQDASAQEREKLKEQYQKSQKELEDMKGNVKP